MTRKSRTSDEELALLAKLALAVTLTATVAFACLCLPCPRSGRGKLDRRHPLHPLARAGEDPRRGQGGGGRGVLLRLHPLLSILTRRCTIGWPTPIRTPFPSGACRRFSTSFGQLFAQAYFTAEALGVTDKVHTPLFEGDPQCAARTSRIRNAWLGCSNSTPKWIRRTSSRCTTRSACAAGSSKRRRKVAHIA